MNFSQFFKQGFDIQKKMHDLQNELLLKEVEGKSGGSAVVVKMKGNKEIISVKISPSLINKEEKEILEDLVMAAVNDALAKLTKLSKEHYSEVFSKIPGMPSNFEFPFF